MIRTIFDDNTAMEDIIKNLFTDKYSKLAKVGALSFFEHRNLGKLLEKYGHNKYFSKSKSNSYDVYKFNILEDIKMVDLFGTYMIQKIDKLT